MENKRFEPLLSKEIIVESPFTFEQEAKQGTYLWLSAYPVPKDEENLENLQLPKTERAL